MSNIIFDPESQKFTTSNIGSNHKRQLKVNGKLNNQLKTELGTFINNTSDETKKALTSSGIMHSRITPARIGGGIIKSIASSVAKDLKSAAITTAHSAATSAVQSATKSATNAINSKLPINKARIFARSPTPASGPTPASTSCSADICKD